MSEITFDTFQFDNTVLDSIYSMGFKNPTPIQQQSIPVIQEGKDVIACAQTGTGKTAAFLLPIIDEIVKKQIEHTHCLIIVPTRELAVQIEQNCEGTSYFTGASAFSIYGGGTGESFNYEKRALTNGTNIIIATPGRLISHLNLGYVKFDQLGCVILDEADKMLDMGFFEDIIKIIRHVPKERQTLLFSATMPKKIRELSARILRNPSEINIAISKTASGVKQLAYMCYENQKVSIIEDVLTKGNYESVIIFTSKKSSCDTISQRLRKRGLGAHPIHSGLDQGEREDRLRKFTAKDFPILVATDILSRGIHIDNISLVINFEVPGDAEDYVHRVGRTARAASKGEAITLITEEDQRKFAKIEDLIDKSIEKPAIPEALGEAPQYNPQFRGGGKKPFKGGNKKRKFHKKRFDRNKPKE